MPSITNLKYLLALQKNLHFAKSAQECCVSQSTLSAGIKKLEQDLGIKLFERTNKIVLITNMGEKIALQAAQIIQNIHNLEKIATANFFSSEIKIGIIPTIAPYLLSGFINKVKHQHPQMQFIIIEDTSNNLLKKLDNLELDFAILAFPFDTSNNNIVQFSIFTDELSLIQHKNWSDDKNTQKSILILEQGHCLRDHVLKKSNIKHEQISDISCSNLETIVTMVDMELGISFIPRMAIDSGILQKYKNITCKHTTLSREIGIVYHHSNTSSDNILQLGNLLIY